MKILMVCLGNICRSPLAEGILQHKARKAGLDWNIESAGTNGFHDGEAPHHLSQKVAGKYGLDISRQISRRFTPGDMTHYDRIYAMADDVLRDIKRMSGNRFDPAKTRLFLEALKNRTDKNVPDPWYGEEEGYDEVYTLIDQAADAIIEEYLADHQPTIKHYD